MYQSVGISYVVGYFSILTEINTFYTYLDFDSKSWIAHITYENNTIKQSCQNISVVFLSSKVVKL